jgi:hypothetical protein
MRRCIADFDVVEDSIWPHIAHRAFLSVVEEQMPIRRKSILERRNQIQNQNINNACIPITQGMHTDVSNKKIQRTQWENSEAHSLRKAKKEVELTAMTSSGAPFTIWKSFRMKPEGTSPC